MLSTASWVHAVLHYNRFDMQMSAISSHQRVYHLLMCSLVQSRMRKDWLLNGRGGLDDFENEMDLQAFLMGQEFSSVAVFTCS